MRVAKLVEASLVVRVIVDENATDDEVIAASRQKFVELVQTGLGDNVVGWEDDDEMPATKEEQDENWTAILKPIRPFAKPLDITAVGYASLSIGEQLWLLKTRFSISEKEAREIRTDDIYGLPHELASDFKGFVEHLYPDENR